jgi:cytochrome c oxidase subunit 2
MHSFFHPESPQGVAVLHLFWWMFWIGAAIWAVVLAMVIYAARARRGHRHAEDVMVVSTAEHRRLERAVIGAGAATVVILLVFLVFDFSVGRALSVHPQNALTIDVVGHQWWWEVKYENPSPSHIITTANEIHVPVGAMVQFKLSSADVIHSFWAPALNGKRDLIPGYTSAHWFRADTAGVYRGQCAEFCGMQHAKMAFYVIAEPPAKFAAWLAAAALSDPPPTDSTLLYGQRVFMSSGCAVCHTIGGTPAKATVGPPLSHFKGRATIAAGTLANTRENLTNWIKNPDAFKPGVHMPAYPLNKVQLDALVSYLETLK